jgi:hypothetical protein
MLSATIAFMVPTLVGIGVAAAHLGGHQHSRQCIANQRLLDTHRFTPCLTLSLEMIALRREASLR